MADPELQVSGGAGGVEARHEDLVTLARHSEDLALALGSISAECHAVLADPDVVASGVIDPAGMAHFEQTLLEALNGRGGLTALGLAYGERAVQLRAASATYQAVDTAQARLVGAMDWSVGHVLGTGILVAPGLALAGAAGVGVVAWALGPDKVQRLLTAHPGMIDGVVNTSPGLLNGLLGAPTFTVPSAARLVGRFYPDGNFHGTDLGTDIHSRMTKPPEGFTDLIDGLDYRNGRAKAGAPDQIDVRVITHPDGTKAYIVDIPGTKVWDAPGQFDPHLNDLGTNVHAMGGDVTAREQAIADALRRAGADPTDPVMLVGHSQGGIVAAQAAQDTGIGGFPYRVTHVVTAGAPIGRIDVPDTVQVLSLENSHDIVPHLDGTDNPDRPNHTTVTFNTQNGNIGQNHGTGSAYLPAARSLDHSTDPSVQAYRTSAGAFLPTPGDGTTVEAHVYAYDRTP